MHVPRLTTSGPVAQESGTVAEWHSESELHFTTSPLRHCRSQGMTLTEVLIASGLATLVVIGLVNFDVSSSRIQDELRARAQVGSSQPSVALASRHLTRTLQQADRLFIRNTGLSDGQGDLQARVPVMVRNTPPSCTGCVGSGAVPPACCFNDPTNYQWNEYRLVGGDLRLYENTASGCSRMTVLASGVRGVAFSYRNEALDPPGPVPPMEPAGADNNVLEYALLWDNARVGDADRNREFRSEVVSRAIPYSHVNAASNRSGSGLDNPSLVSAPPTPCPR